MILDILKETRSILRDRTQWTTKVYARNAVGVACTAIDASAVCWCTVGAIQKAAADRLGGGDDAWDLADSVMAYLVERTGDSADPAVISYESQLADINDRQGHDVVLDLLDGAIAQIEAGGAHVG